MDAILPEVGASVASSLLDICMITTAGIERTAKHWRTLLEGVVLEIRSMSISFMGDGIIETVLADEP